jgi:hypothetical protein|tara:strand:- start:2067 stop:2309 length:243 start_codon:yes stop_codon:yes gene_type:complete
MDKRTELDKAKQKVMEEEYLKSYILWEDSPIDVFGVSKEIDRIKKLVNELYKKGFDKEAKKLEEIYHDLVKYYFEITKDL